LEKLLANIDLKNDIVTESKFIRRPSRFRPSLNRAQIRKKAETALKPKLRNSRIRIRKPNTTTEKTIVTTVQRKEQEQEVEATTQAIVLSEQSSEEIIEEQQTAVTEVYEDVTEAVSKEALKNVQIKNEVIDEVTTERENIPTTKRVETFRNVDRANFFRRNSPRRFGFGRKPGTTSAPKLKQAVPANKVIVSNKVPKEADLKFGSFPVINRLNTVTPKANVVKEIISKPKPLVIQATQPTRLPHPFSNEIEPAFNLIISESQPKLKLNNRENSFISPNLIVQPAFLKPIEHKQPSQIPETQRSIVQPRRPVHIQTSNIQPLAPVPQTVEAKQGVKTPLRESTDARVNSISREPIFPKFELPEFFKVPFAAFQAQANNSPSKVDTSAQKQAGVLFSGVGQPQGRVQGHPRATNLNILTGSYSVGW